MFPSTRAFLAVLLATSALSQTHTDFEKRLQAVMSRAEYKHSRFGVEVYSLDEGKVLYSWNPQELFVPGSTTKILSVGSALELLGPDFRFHTKIYRTGPITEGAVNGDLVLVASGDPNLSNRIQPDGTMVFEDEDHSYDGFAEARAVPGDPLAVIKEMAAQVAAKGIRRVTGRVLVDISLFREGARDLGTGVVISPIVLNDNLVDVLVSPGATDGTPATVAIAPQTRYVTIANDVKTGAPGSKMDLRWTRDTTSADGTHAVVLSGSIPAGGKPKLRVYKVPAPSKYAETVLAEALAASGVQVDGKSNPAPAPSLYTPENEVAEHVSPTLQEAARITLKVSQNLHASMMPYIVGAYKVKGSPNALQAGFDQESVLLQKADLDLTGAVQNDGAGGDALFAPDFMVHFLLHLTKQPFGPQFLRSLPVLGKDGTLAAIQVHSPAAGHVFAKTGTFSSVNALNKGGGVIMGKALAGFVDAKDGRRLAIAIFINLVPVKELGEQATQMVGEAVGEIAAAAYDGFPPAGKL